MKIKVKVFASLRERVGWKEKEYDVEAKDMNDSLKVVGGKLYDIIMDKEKEELIPQYKVLLNCRDIDFLDGLRTKLKDQDSLLIFPSVGGGQSSLQLLFQRENSTAIPFYLPFSFSF